jgi:Putative zinc-binding metallo-peptidase
MIATSSGAAVIDGCDWIGCTKAADLGCNWLMPEEQSDRANRGRCVADSLIRRGPAADDTIAVEKLASTAVDLRRLTFHITDTINTVGEAGLILVAGRARVAVPRDIVPLASYADAPIEQLLDDWKWVALFFNRINTAMGKRPLYPFEIPPPVIRKLDFVHKVIRQTA